MSHHSELPEFVFSPWQQRQGLPDIIEAVLQQPIQSKRWRRLDISFLQALNDRAELHQQSSETETWLAARAALSLTLPELPPIAFDGTDLAPDSLKAWSRVFRRLVNDEVTKDLLGLDWRQPPFPPASHLEAVERNLALEVDYLLASPRLTDHEKRIIEAIRPIVVSGGSLDEAADQLQIPYGALKRTLQRIRAKTA